MEAERFDQASQALQALCQKATRDDLLAVAKILAVEATTYRRTYGGLTIPTMLPLLINRPGAAEAAALAEALEYLAALLRSVSSGREDANNLKR